MSSSTLPKSLQAQASSTTIEGQTSDSNPQDRAQNFREFVERLRHLPDDFLRIPNNCYLQTRNMVVQAPQPFPTRDSPLVDMIDISVVEAQLVKNYGLLRMDLYCKIRVGHMVCETQTCLNGAKNPKWDGVYQFSLKPGIDSFHLEIYDEKQFSLDEKVAWLSEPIPPEIFQGITIERWFPLSGRSGLNKEGSILLVLSHKRVPMRSSNFGRNSVVPPLTVYVPSANHSMISRPPIIPVAPHNSPYMHSSPPLASNLVPQDPAAALDVRQLQISDDDVERLSEMFPSIDKAIIKAVLENNHNDKEAAIGALLALG